MLPAARQQLRRQLALARPLSTTAARSEVKIPNLGEITHSPQKSAAFREKVSSFRESLLEQRAAQARAAAASNAPDHTDLGIVKSILYGSEKGQREEAEMEQSYSTVLARGKYVHAIEFHHVKPECHDAYVELVGNSYPKIAADRDNNCHLVGSWKTEIGDPDTFGMFPTFPPLAGKRQQGMLTRKIVHIWEYQGYAGYHSTLNHLATTSVYQTYKKELPSLLTGRRTDLMQEFSFWPTTPPRKLGGIFELRSYTLKPGNLLDWETHWRTGLKARRNVMEGVGAWFTQVGALNNIHYLWQFQDLRERQVGREKSWNEKGWSGTVHKTIPLIDKMESRILVPLPWSPVA